jgi:adenylate cyclase
VSKQRRRANRQAIGVGLAATAAVLLIYAVGGLDWLEFKTLDLRFLYANSIPDHGGLVCIDIDDAALDIVGRWPWPRDVQAGIISILAELGVKTLLVDITLGEAEPLRTILPRQADIAYDLRDLLKGYQTAATAALPDQALRTAMEDVGRVYLATDYAAGDERAVRQLRGGESGEDWQKFLESDDFRAVLEALQKGDEKEAERLAAGIPARRLKADGPAWNPRLWARLVAAFEGDLTLADETLAGRLADANRKAALQACEGCRELAFRRRVRGWLDAEPQRWATPSVEIAKLYDPLEQALIAGSPRYRETLAQALREVLNAHATTAATLVPLARVSAAAPVVDAISPVYFVQARAARRCGFVVFDPDEDGIMRRTRLLVQHEGRVLGQLAFDVALDEWGTGAADVSGEPGWLVVAGQAGAKPLRIQLDAEGRTLVPWVAQRDWSRQFGDHVPIGAVWQVFDRRQSIAHNRGIVLERLRALPLVDGLDPNQYCEDLATYLNLEQRVREARYWGNRQAIREAEGLLAQAEQFLTESGAALRAALAGVSTRPATNATGADAEAARARLAQLREVEQALAANDEYKAEIKTTLDRLRKRIEGKIGLLGYTATALADMTPVPTHARAPGVMAHANLLNGLLGGRMVYWAPVWLNAALAALLGVLATLMSVRYGPRVAAGIGVLAIGYIALAGWLAFYVWTYWVALTPAVGALLASNIFVLVHRYLFLEREKRQLTTALGQYTSATLARKMAEDAELCRRAEMREVTAVFTDLEGFTTISEEIGAERTQHVLNVALGRLSDVMLYHEGMINKFIGDGIFAFWNPVIYPQPDHARRACESAVDLMAAMRELGEEQRQAGGDEVFGRLVLRIGVATGHAVVGPCGSEKKYDYTCIGDSVNVASRLESANKFYGTHVLISGATHGQAGEGFVVRALGGVQVKGKTQAVPIYELLGRTGDMPEEQLRYAERFGAAVVAFQERAWKQALAAFEACRGEQPDDLAAVRYMEAVQQYLAVPPADDWNGALELTEK